MPSRDHYNKVARELASYMNTFKLAFKTYRISELDDMVKNVAGEGSRLSTSTAASEFTQLLQERGFIIFPSLAEAAESDQHVRIFRANTIVANLLTAFRYPGASGDEDLARMLRTMRTRNTRPDDLSSPDVEPS